MKKSEFLFPYTLESLRAQIGVVTQQTILFNRSVADNIAHGNRKATLEQIEDAARRVNAHEFITNLAKGYDIIIGERGARLFGGQKQRIAIAWAFLKNAPILIIDEATSSLDSDSEEKVQLALNELVQDRTVILIAHRFSTIRMADKIIVMGDGCVRSTDLMRSSTSRTSYIRAYTTNSLLNKKNVKNRSSHRI
jgi:ABC-type multidrug transport system fused ATPase/permease subunit